MDAVTLGQKLEINFKKHIASRDVEVPQIPVINFQKQLSLNVPITSFCIMTLKYKHVLFQ